MKILGLSTYPIVEPKHGGQRRIAAMKEYYASVGVEYHYCCAYQPEHVSAAEVGEDDIPFLDLVDDPYRNVPFLDDLRAGLQAGGVIAGSEKIYQHFKGVFDRISPDVVQLEHPFMWPFYNRLRKEVERAPTLVYSSHNIEAPLKRDILEKNNVVGSDAIDRIVAHVEATERSVLDAAALVIACSERDRSRYDAIVVSAPVVLVNNGVSRPTRPDPAMQRKLKGVFGDYPFLFFVGSAYPPNASGYLEMLAEDGLFWLPPEKHVLICGGVADLIYQSPDYLRYHEANSYRVHFEAKLNDAELAAAKEACHAVVLPIVYGGGSNLKTAEALALGKWVVATSVALRGFSEFEHAPGIAKADEPIDFRRAASTMLRRPPLTLTDSEKQARDVVYWDKAFERGDVIDVLTRRMAKREKATSVLS